MSEEQGQLTEEQRLIQARVDKCRAIVEEALKTYHCKLVYKEEYHNSVLVGAIIFVDTIR